MNPVVSFSLFGTDMKYYVGAEKNVEQIKKMLPNWDVVIYYHQNMIRDGYVDKLTSMGAEMIDVTNITLNGKPSMDYPYFWRFLSFLDDRPSISRDLDSRFSDREISYINNWLSSNCDYFIIRDHPWHAPVPSGLFGIKRKISEFETHFIDFVNNQDLRWGADQEILYQYIQNIKKEDIFYCGYDIRDNYISRDDKNFFIGMQMDENDEPTKPSGVQCLTYINELNF